MPCEKVAVKPLELPKAYTVLPTACSFVQISKTDNSFALIFKTAKSISLSYAKIDCIKGRRFPVSTAYNR